MFSGAAFSVKNLSLHLPHSQMTQMKRSFSTVFEETDAEGCQPSLGSSRHVDKMSAAAELEANRKRREDNAKRQAGELPPEQGT